MAGLKETTAALRRYRKAVEAAAAHKRVGGAPQLIDIPAFGDNPGDLRMLTYAPAGLVRPPLVVVLHGCTQTAEGYQHGAGWAALAERCGFVLLCPEQKRQNNPNVCFNWFEPGDTQRDRGEVASIRQMIARAVDLFDCDPAKVYVTGLSAGAAMANALLASYPEVFAGGALIAGLPYGAAASVQEAFAAMTQIRPRPAPDWARAVTSASRHQGPWPAVSIWHGDADSTVTAVNADELVKQWTAVHGIDAAAETDALSGHRRRRWRGADGEVKVASYTILGMGHGAPLAAADGLGAAGPFLLEAGISSSLQIVRDWDLAPPADAAAEVPALVEEPQVEVKDRPFDIGETINRALAAAGLIR